MADKEVKALEEALARIWEIAIKNGLDPFPTKFEIVPATVMYEVGSYALPGRYSHWTFGKAYHRMKTMYDFGLSKIYEVVINTNPSYGFLLETNSLLQNKLVIAHVLGHVDFFKNNVYFSKTNRRMVDEVSAHAKRISDYEYQYGRKTIEEFLDAVLSIEEHIDPNFFIKKDQEVGKGKKSNKEGRYDDLFNLEKKAKGKADEKAAKEAAKGKGKKEKVREKNPLLPEKDLVHFIMRNSPTLEPWQRDIMAMIHQEMEYFVPQMQTKIMNEGWACATGDSLLLTENGFIYFDELYAKRKKINVAPGNSNSVFSITDFHQEQKVPTIKIRTSRGLSLEGALKHRVQLKNGDWAFLKDIKLGDKITFDVGANIWPTKPIAFLATQTELNLGNIASQSTCSAFDLMSVKTVASDMNRALKAFSKQSNKEIIVKAKKIVPKFLNKEIAWLAGYTNQTNLIPKAILRSPKEIMSSFLQGYFDANGQVESSGIKLVSKPENLIKTIQIILLNYGIYSQQQELEDNNKVTLEISGLSAKTFSSEIGFKLTAKQQALELYTQTSTTALETPEDTIVAIEEGLADVFDITVAEKHSYVANGFINHNSFWHARIMRELDLSTEEHIEFANLHSSVVCPHKNQLNPYYLGYKIFEDIEKRWDNPTEEERKKYGRSGGEGRAKIFEVRELDNDTSFLRNYLTRDLCEELDLFVFELQDDEWTVTEKNWERVRDTLVANMTNFGCPYIEVTDDDYNGNRELYLKHRYEGTELELKYARKVLEYVQQLWGRTVHLETVTDNESTVLHYNGEEHKED